MTPDPCKPGAPSKGCDPRPTKGHSPSGFSEAGSNSVLEKCQARSEVLSVTLDLGTVDVYNGF